MKAKIKSKEFLGLLAGTVIVLTTVLILNSIKADETVRKATEVQGEPRKAEQKTVIMEGEETKDWKVFRHKEMGFSIKYPDDVILSQNRPGMVVFTKEEYWNRKTYPFASIQILDRDVEDNEPVSALRRETPGGAKPAEFEPATINNALGIRITRGSGADYDFYINDEDKIGPVVRVTVGSDKKEENISDFVLMLSTFRFER